MSAGLQNWYSTDACNEGQNMARLYTENTLAKSTNEISDKTVSRYLYVFICVKSGLGPPPPDIGPDCSTHN
jgi:hypothetical protein